MKCCMSAMNKEVSAGAIIYTINKGVINYLVLLDFHNNWGFPKGHLENNETLIEAAYREIKEEVGLNVEIDTNFKEELVYIMPNGIEKHSIYYLAKFDNQTPVKQIEEVRDIKILPYEEVLDILTFDNMKEVLIKANDYLTK